MSDWLSRTELLVKTEGLQKLQKSKVLIVGLGGVGAAAAEFITRAGVENLTIIDGDTIDNSNINRQLPATSKTVGKSKVNVVAKHLKDINPNVQLTEIDEFIEPERVEKLKLETFDYIVDCIDSITPKLHFIIEAKSKGVPIISSMGAGGKMKAKSVQVSDISKTYNCMMARTIRKRLKYFKIYRGLKVVFSNEMPKEGSLQMTNGDNYKKSFYGTISYMPSLFGLHIAETVICDLLEK